MHLFNVEVHNGPVLMEGRSTAPGTQVQSLPLVATAPLPSLWKRDAMHGCSADRDCTRALCFLHKDVLLRIEGRVCFAAGCL